MAKVANGLLGDTVGVYPDSFGEKRVDDKGREYMYAPLPICRVPTGHGRNLEQATAIAEEIAGLINRQARYGTVPAGNVSGLSGGVMGNGG